MQQQCKGNCAARNLSQQLFIVIRVSQARILACPKRHVIIKLFSAHLFQRKSNWGQVVWSCWLECFCTNGLGLQSLSVRAERTRVRLVHRQQVFSLGFTNDQIVNEVRECIFCTDSTFNRKAIESEIRFGV